MRNKSNPTFNVHVGAAAVWSSRPPTYPNQENYTPLFMTTALVNSIFDKPKKGRGKPILVFCCTVERFVPKIWNTKGARPVSVFAKKID